MGGGRGGRGVGEKEGCLGKNTKDRGIDRGVGGGEKGGKEGAWIAV